MKRSKLLFIIGFALLAWFNSGAEDIDLWFSITVGGTTADVDLYAKSNIGNLSTIDGIQWAIAYKETENTPSTTLIYDLTSSWGPTIGAPTTTVGGYDHMIYLMGGTGGSDYKTIGSGSTLLATIRFTKIGTWGKIHIISEAEDGVNGCIIVSGATQYSLKYPTEDSSLPVQMSQMSATASKMNGVVLSWETKCEVDCAGFHVVRSLSETGAYQRVTTALIPGQGNSSTLHRYNYIDKNVENDKIYWYKIIERSTDGKEETFGPISVVAVSPVPEEYGLSQNFPNPFNPVTSFQYELPEDSPVLVRVYSFTGKEVKTLVNGSRQAGRYDLSWNGTDDSNQKVTSGVYILQLKAGSFHSIRKMTYVR